MITLPEYLEKQLITLAHKKNATTDKILEWALKSLEYDLADSDDAEQTLADIKTGKEPVLTLEQFNQALTS
jgi:hypothetical protein